MYECYLHFLIPLFVSYCSLLLSQSSSTTVSASSSISASTTSPNVNEDAQSSLQTSSVRVPETSFSSEQQAFHADDASEDTDGDFLEQSERLTKFRIRMDTTIARRTERALQRQERRQFSNGSTMSSSQSPLCTGRLCQLPVDMKKAAYCSSCNSVFHSKSCLRFYQNSHECI
jgi:hypothetical protein